MKLSLGNASGGSKQQSPVLMVVLVVLILGAVGFTVKNMMGDSGGGESVAPPLNATGMMAPPPGMGGPGMPPGGPSHSAPVAQTPAAPATTPSASPLQAPASAAAPAAAPAPAKVAPSEAKMDTLKVFNAVTVSYPSTWKISANPANNGAIFTDGKASLGVYPPDVKANNSTAIALAGVKTLTPGAKAIAQGKTTIAGQDSFWMKVSFGGKTAKVIGIDGPTRVVVVESAPAAKYAGYVAQFQQMETALRF